MKVFFISPSHSLAVSTCTEVFYSNLVKLNLFANNLCLNWRQIIPFLPALSYSGVLATISLLGDFTSHPSLDEYICCVQEGGLVDHWDEGRRFDKSRGRRELLAKLLRITTAGGGRGGGKSQGGDFDC